MESLNGTPRPRTTRRLGLYGGAVAVAGLLFLAGCGGGGASNQAGGGQRNDTSGGQQSLAECLEQHGVSPDGIRRRRPTGAPGERPTGASGERPSIPPEIQEAVRACASLRPDPAQEQGGSAMEAFRHCMNEHGAELPERTDRRMLPTSDPEVAEALETCRPLLPTGAPVPTRRS